jgi:aminoglycoside phosphotransferase (APT) family kinase protein
MNDPLDIEQPEQLLAYLRDSGRLAPGEPAPQIRVLAGGVSNRTVRVERAGGEAWVIKQALAKLRVKVDWFSDVARIHREALGLKYLAQLAPPGTITPLIFEDHEHHLLAMAAVPEPHENWKTMLMDGPGDSRHVIEFAEILALIHRRSHERREELATVFDDRSFFETLRLEPYYGYTAGQVPDAAAFLHDLIDSTRARRLTLVHGDYSPKNVLVRGADMVLLDHEVIHFGDPAFDVGFAMTHLLSKAHHFAPHRRIFMLFAAEFWAVYETYLQAPGWAEDLEAHAIQHTLGCLLARVAGRSPLEYLDDEERAAQARVVVKLMSDPPATVAELVLAFAARL